MNSSSTVCVEDFYRRLWRRDESDQHYLKVARVLTLIWGILAILMAFAFRHVQYAQDTWSKVMSFSTTGVLALMILAFFPVRIRPAAAIAGWATAAASVAVMSFATDVHFLLYPVIGNVLGFVVAILWNAVGLWLKAMYRMCPEEVFPLEETRQTDQPREAGAESLEGETQAEE